MQRPSPPWLERAAGGLALLVMLILLALTIGSPAGAASAPIIIIPTPALEYAPLPARLHAPERRTPPDTLEAPAVPAAREAPAPAVPPADAPAIEVLAAHEAAPAAAAIETSQLITEPDGTVRLPGVDDWMKDLPPDPTATPVPAVSGPLPPRTGCVARRGCP